MIKLERDIDSICRDLTLKIEALRKLLKAEARHNTSLKLSEKKYVFAPRQREKALEDAIHWAILKLEETKKSFKSRVIKEVREELTKAIEG